MEPVKKNFIHIGYFVAAIWVVFILSQILPLNSFGIVPRSPMGLVGVAASPFLHGSLHHIISNTAALLIFAPIFSLVEGEHAIEKVVILTIITGILTWIVGRPAVHIGASGVIFALYGYLISLGYFKRKIGYMALSVFLLVSYGYMFFGLLPVQVGVSWEGHLSGFVAGIILAKFK